MEDLVLLPEHGDDLLCFLAVDILVTLVAWQWASFEVLGEGSWVSTIRSLVVLD